MAQWILIYKFHCDFRQRVKCKSVYSLNHVLPGERKNAIDSISVVKMFRLITEKFFFLCHSRVHFNKYSEYTFQHEIE